MSKVTNREAQVWDTLTKGSAITLWAASASSERLWPGAARPLQDKVDYRFRNGWVDTGDLPCRQALYERPKERFVPLPTGPFDEVVMADDAGEVDFSTFRYRPTLISRAFRVALQSPEAGKARFRVETCGGLRLWCDDKAVGVFEPFMRNQRSATEISFDIPAGVSHLTLLLEELHERDTQNFFSVTYSGGPTIKAALPSDLCATDLRAAINTMTSLHFERVFYDEGEVRVRTSTPPIEPLDLSFTSPFALPRGGIVSSEGPERHSMRMLPERPEATLFNAADALPGCQTLTVTAHVGRARITRKLCTTILSEGTMLEGPYQERKAQAADIISDLGHFEPGVALLLALRGEKPELVERILSHTLQTIEDRHDCSDFSMLPLLRLWRDGAETLPAALRARLKRAILGYRYWMQEPGNDVMWFWSENHVLCFHTAQCVAGALFPDDIFANSGRTGRDLAADAAIRLERWFEAIEADGLCEWNSAAYYPIDMIGLLTLHDMAPELRGKARDLLDWIFAMTALHTSGSVPAGCQGRCYEKELLAGPATELGAVAAMAFGGRYSAGFDRAASLLCVSDYVPPDGLSRFAAPPEGQVLEAQYTQGFGAAGQLRLWKSSQAQLSTSQTGVPGAQGHQAHVVDMQAAAHPMARLWINHPGELTEWGDRRPSLLAGNHVISHVVQSGPTAVLLYDLERDWTKLHFTQLFATKHAFATPSRAGEWWVFEAGDSVTGIWCSAPLSAVDGTYAGSLWRAYAKRVAWVIEVKGPDEPAHDFVGRLAQTKPVFDQAALHLSTQLRSCDHLTTTFGADSHLNGAPLCEDDLSVVPRVGWDGGALRHWRDHGTGTDSSD